MKVTAAHLRSLPGSGRSVAVQDDTQSLLKQMALSRAADGLTGCLVSVLQESC